MNEQIQTIIDRARVLLAAATPGPVAVGVGEVETEDAGRHRAVLIHTDAYCVAACGSPGDPHSHADAEALAFAVNNIGTLCEALVDAEAERDAMQQKLTRFNPGTGKAEPWDPDETLRGIRDHIPDDRRLDGFTLAGAVSEMAKLLAAAEVERDALRERAGIAEGREAAAKANAAEMAGWLSARNAGLVQMARDRDAALAQVECLKAQRDVARQDARRAENERDALRDESGPRITVAELQRESYETARAKGWHDEDDQPPSDAMIRIAAEGLYQAARCRFIEAYRKGERGGDVMAGVDPMGTVATLSDRQVRVIAWLALVCTEVAEAIDDVVAGRWELTIGENGKPEGLPSELADVFIRGGDDAGALGIDLENAIRAKLAFNRTRSHKHGGKLA